MRRHLFLALGLLAVAWSCAHILTPAWGDEDAEPLIAAGDEGELEVPGSDFPCHILVPSDYVKGVRLPLIFFLHGSGGKPTAWPWRTATGAKGYFIVGLSYGAQDDGGAGGIRSDPATQEAMLAFIEKVRTLVHARYGIDQRRVFLTGLSMGGWGVNMYGFLDAARGRYRGYCIMAAGIRQGAQLDLTVLEGLPLLLLNGAKDANLPAANRGVPIFKKAGALVKQVVLEGEGHVPSIAAMAPPLKAWLDEIQKADDQQHALAAIKWIDVSLEGAPSKSGGSKEEALLAWLGPQSFMQRDTDGKPVLVFLSTDHDGKKGRPSRPALESLRVEDETFGFPSAVDTPAAARPYACFRASLSALEKKASPLLHRELAPVALLVDRDRKSLVLLTKGKLKDAALAKELRTLLAPEEVAAADARVVATKPVIVEMRKLRKEIGAVKKALAKLRRKPPGRVSKKLAKSTALLEALAKRYEELHAQLGT